MIETAAAFISKLAVSLTVKVMEAAGRRIRARFKDSPREEALQRCFKAGIAAMTQDAIQPEGMEAYLENVLKPFFEEPDVAKELEKLLHSEPPDMEGLKEIYEEIYEEATILARVSFEESMAAFLKGFESKADEETVLQGQLTLSVLREMRDLLRDQTRLNPSVSARERRYLERLIERCNTLDLALGATQHDDEGRVYLSDVFTQLMLEGVIKSKTRSVSDAILKKKEDILERHEDREKTTPVSAVEAVAAMDRLVILGRPGGGKSTLVNYICTRLARERLGEKTSEKTETMPGWSEGAPLLPVRIILRRFAAWRPPVNVAEGTAGHVWAYIEHQLRTWGCAESYAFVEEELKEQRGIVFFDGLDEVSETDEAAMRTTIKIAIEDFARSETKTRIVVTCREYAYQETDRWRLKRSLFPDVMLALFNLDQIRTFTRAWYQTVAPLKEWESSVAEEKARVLYQTVERLPYLRELAQYPLLLTLMVQVHGGEGYLPKDRADLYDKAVTLLLAVWDNRIVIDVEASRGIDQEKVLRIGISTEALRKVLAEVAYKAHKRQETDRQRDERAADIPTEELRSTLLPATSGQEEAQEIMDYIQHRAGVLVANDNYTYSFLHRTLQEYLAATYILQQSTHAEILERHLSSDLEWWREVFLLAAGDARYPVMVANLVDQLVPFLCQDKPLTVERSRRINLAAQALWETGFVEEALKEEENEAGRYSTTYRKILDWLSYACRAEELDAVSRVACGEALGHLGDSRPGVCRVEPIDWCEVAPGAFWMGSDDDDSEALSNEKPQHRVEITYTYWISKYPITVAQFRQYVQEAGITPGDPDSLGGAPNCPVVLISWHEATSFCRWMTEKMQALGREMIDGGETHALWKGLSDGELIVTLPGEAEWEKAARGMNDRRIWPWKGAWDGGKSNNAEIKLNKPSPVGCFPGGTSPFGAEDMVGNVWEWCRDWYDDRTYESRKDGETRDPLGPQQGTSRVLRGGSFHLTSGLCRCAARGGNLPSGRFVGSGFRIVLLPLTMADENDEQAV